MTTHDILTYRAPSSEIEGTVRGEPRAPSVTVVIPVRSDPLLSRAIESVPKGADTEIVIALTSPTIDVRDVAAAYAARDQRVLVVQTQRAGMSAGVNLGVQHASCDKVVILDSDCELQPGALQAYNAALDGAAFVRGQTSVARAGGWSEFAGLGQEELNRQYATQPRFMGPSIALRRTDFLEFGGYDEACGASCDHEFALRLERAGVQTFFVHEAWVRHQPITFRIDTRAHYGYGGGMRFIDRKHGGRYGLMVCLERFRPRVLLAKLTKRGPSSAVRSLLLGLLMLAGYCRGRSLG